MVTGCNRACLGTTPHETWPYPEPYFLHRQASRRRTVRRAAVGLADEAQLDAHHDAVVQYPVVLQVFEEPLPLMTHNVLASSDDVTP